MKLSIVLFSRDDAEHLRRCLTTLRDDSVGCPSEVVVVDNASVDHTKEVLESFSGLLPMKVLRLQEDTSFSVGNNLGLAAARGEHVLFLNPDTVPESGVIERCLAVLAKDPRVGLVGPRLVYPEGLHQSNGWNLPHPLRLLGEHLHAIPREVPPSGRDTTEVGWLMGCFLLGRRELLTDLGGFDEAFWFHGTDLELCARVWTAGRKVLRVDDSSLVHVGHRSWDIKRRRASHQALVQYTRREHGLLAAQGVASLSRLAEVFRS